MLLYSLAKMILETSKMLTNLVVSPPLSLHFAIITMFLSHHSHTIHNCLQISDDFNFPSIPLFSLCQRLVSVCMYLSWMRKNLKENFWTPGEGSESRMSVDCQCKKKLKKKNIWIPHLSFLLLPPELVASLVITKVVQFMTHVNFSNIRTIFSHSWGTM